MVVAEGEFFDRRLLASVGYVFRIEVHAIPMRDGDYRVGLLRERCVFDYCASFFEDSICGVVPNSGCDMCALGCWAEFAGLK